ncbi:MAG: TonB-dependent receptor [Bacteroidetes bacterium]|nr:MAG: TonB-dependent receptor [Bacteroidota bacterium]
MKLSLISLFSILTFWTIAQDVTIRGTLYNSANGEPMPYEKIRLLNMDSSTVSGAITDLDGLFSIPKISQGSYIVKAESFGFESATVNVKVEQSSGFIDLNLELKKMSSVQDIDEVKVSAESKRKQNEVLISTIKLDKKGLERIPSVGAENDIVGAFSVTPGVITTGDQGGQLYVRGGTPIQNKILLDGMTIYNPFHSIGFFSIFETELIKNVDIYTGGFDAQYGGRISSIMDITYRDGNAKKFSGKVSASPFMAKAVVEGPFSSKNDGPGGSTYIFSAKHSLIDYSSQTIYPNINRDTTTGNSYGMPFNFTDLYGKVTFKGDGRSKFSAFGFHQRDNVDYTEAQIDWTQSGGGLNFLLVPQNSPLFIKGHVNGSNFKTTFSEGISATDTLERTSSIGGFDLGFDFTYFLKNESEFNYGFNFNGFSTNFLTYNELKRKIELTQFTTEIGAYVNYRLVTTRWVVQPSMRVQVYASYGTISPEPRIGVKYNASEKLRFKASGGRYSQNFTSASSDRDVVNLFNGLLTAPQNVQETFFTSFDGEKSPKNGIQYAYHAIFGFEYDFTKKLSLNMEGYYKYFSQLSNINQNKLYDDISEFSYIDDVYKKDFIIEDGESYGADLLLKYSDTRIFLWGVYSYGFSTRWDGFSQYYPVFDRRHNVNLVATYLFGKNKDLEVSMRWNLGSGLPFTPTSGFYQEENFSSGVTTDYTTSNPSYVATLLGEFNSERLPYYHRLDLTVKKQFKFKNESGLEIVASVTNLYDRRNIFYVNRVSGKTIYQFPILPSLGLSYNW